MTRGVSVPEFGNIVSEERLAELKDMVKSFGYYESMAMGKFLQMRRNIIAFDNIEKIPVGSEVTVFNPKTNKLLLGIVDKYVGTIAHVCIDGLMYHISAEMLIFE